MSPRLFLPLALLTGLALTGCNPAAKLVGKWEIDADKVKADLAANNNPMAAALGGMMAMVKVEPEFEADGTWTLTMGGPLGSQSRSGTWKYVKSDGEVLVLNVAMENEAERELRVKFIDNDHVQMEPPAGSGVPTSQGQAFSFRRVKQ